MLHNYFGWHLLGRDANLWDHSDPVYPTCIIWSDSYWADILTSEIILFTDIALILRQISWRCMERGRVPNDDMTSGVSVWWIHWLIGYITQLRDIIQLNLLKKHSRTFINHQSTIIYISEWYSGNNTFLYSNAAPAFLKEQGQLQGLQIYDRAAPPLQRGFWGSTPGKIVGF